MNGQQDWTTWLMLMNFALAFIVLGSALTVVIGVACEVLAARARRAQQMRGMDAELSAMLAEESDRILARETGLADGDEQFEPSHTHRLHEK